MKMVKKNILIVGDANSFLLHDIVSNICERNSNLVVDILNTNPSHLAIDRNIFHKELLPCKLLLNIQKTTDKVNPYLSFFLMRFVIRRSLKQTGGKYDYIHLHFFNKNFFYINISNFTNLTQNLIISYWGSDFYKRTDSQKQKMLPYINTASRIIFSNPQMMADFQAYFKGFEHKCMVQPIGLEILNYIDSLQESYSDIKGKAKNELGIPPEKLVVSIGYSSHVEQHQVEIIEILAQRLSPAELESLFFIFPLTYGDTTYKDKVVDSARLHGLNFKAFTSTLLKQDVAKIRLLSDVFVHLRDTDQFSGSFQEYLYCRNIVITGKWLPYQFLADKGAYFRRLDSIDDLPETLKQVVENYENEYSKTTVNKEIIAGISHWKNIVDQYLTIYS